MNRFVLIALRNYVIENVTANGLHNLYSSTGIDHVLNALDPDQHNCAETFGEAERWMNLGLALINEEKMEMAKDNLNNVFGTRVDGPALCIYCHEPYFSGHKCGEHSIFRYVPDILNMSEVEVAAMIDQEYRHGQE